MNRLLLVSILSTIAINAYTADQDLVTEPRSAQAFHKIHVEGNNEVDITTGSNLPSVTVSADKAVLANVMTKIDDETLYISAKNQDFWSMFKGFFAKENKPRIIAKIAVASLTNVDASGSSTVNINDLRPAKKIKLEFSGTTNGLYTGTGVANKIEFESSGDSNYGLEGATDKLKIETTGSAIVNAEKLKAQQVEIESSGQANIKVNALESIDAEASGESTIEVSGNPKQVKQNISGGSKMVMKK
jgi:hypothetical protein